MSENNSVSSPNSPLTSPTLPLLQTPQHTTHLNFTELLQPYFEPPAQPSWSPLTPRPSRPSHAFIPQSSPLSHRFLPPTSPLSQLRSSSPPFPFDEQQETAAEAAETQQPPNSTFKSDTWKLQRILDCIISLGWTLSKFLSTWVREARGNDPNIRLVQERYSLPIHRRRMLFTFLKGAAMADAIQQAVTETCVTELNNLRSSPMFGKFDPLVDIDTIEFSTAYTDIQLQAPVWSKLATSLMVNQRAHRESYEGNQDSGAMLKRLFMLTSMICHSRAPKTSNYLCSILDVYLLGSGVKRRCIETGYGLGACHSYNTCIRTLNEVSEIARNKIPSLARNYSAVTVYDNFNFKETVRNERLGHAAKMVNLTTASIVYCPEIPIGGLWQSMHNPTIGLRLLDILQGPAVAGDKIGADITRSLIYDAVKRVHETGVNAVFSTKEQRKIYAIPVLKRLKARKTEFWQIGGISENEGTIAGTYKVHDDIFLRQYKMSREEKPGASDTDADAFRFKTQLHLVHGDQLTCQHNRSVKQEQAQATLDYDRRKWLLPLPAWFHIQLNLLNTIVKTHWKPDVLKSTHSLLSDMVTLGRSHGVPSKLEYHQMEPLLAQSFTARVTALFYTAMEKKGLWRDIPSDSLEKREHITRLIGELSIEQFNGLVDDVYATAFSLEAWNGKYHDGQPDDPDFTSMCRMLQEIEIFLTVRHAVKTADIGMMRRLVDILIIVFLGAGQHNYATEMLYYRWQLSDINTPELQHAILASGLVNWQGRATTWKPIDLGQEHLNGGCKIEMKCYKNSTHDINIIFDRVCLTNTWLRQLRGKVEGEFGKHNSGSHTTNPALDDMFTLARNHMEKRSTRRQKANRDLYYKSPDILGEGSALLEAKLASFNSSNVVCQGRVQVAIDETEDVNETNIVGGNLVEESDGVLDPTVAISLDE